ncbi:hypothetical protein PC121_g18404 [Phytophthora cactorum]|nr:hypothetical protein PC121_g18404 [Phytophthora cactorum]
MMVDAVLDGKTHKEIDALSGTVAILPSASRQSDGGEPPDHPSFSVQTKLPASLSGNSSSTEQSPPKKQISAAGLAIPAPVKETVEPSESRPKSYVPFGLSTKTPNDVRRDLEKIYRRAYSVSMAVWERAYPWEGRHVWYDPIAYLHFHVVNWRFWQTWQLMFFE